VLSPLTDIVKYALIPGSLSCLLAGLAVGTICLYVPRLRGFGRAWLTAFALAYVALATPAVADRIVGGLGPESPRIETPVDAKGATAIVVLGAGAVTFGHGTLALHELSGRSIVNAIEAARLFRLLGGVPVITSGGIVNPRTLERPEADLLADALVTLGVPRARILVERASVNTYEQSVRVAALVPGPRFVLVTTPIHLRRAVALFEARGFHPVPAPSNVDTVREPETDPVRLPNLWSLRQSELALYEYLAVANARARGWLARRDTIP
jgi:uncharacterized SAM-binding protein YcdF (DUF218 family)